MKQNKVMGETMTYIVLVALFVATSAIAETAKIPDVTGQWKFTVGVGPAVDVTYENVLDPNGQPVYTVHTNAPTGTTGPIIDISSQNGRVFAGHWVSGATTNALTGAIMEDNTITMQASGSINRHLFWGKLFISGKKRTIKATLHGWDDLSLASEPGIDTGYFYFEATEQ